MSEERINKLVPKLRFPEFKKSEDWEKMKLGEYLKQHPEYGINAPAVPFSNKLPIYIRITDISEDGEFLKNQLVSVEKEVTEINYLQLGDIVLARPGASVGKSYKYRIEDGELVFAGFLIRVTPNQDKLSPEFLFQYLSTDTYWKWVNFTSTRSGQPGINGNEYASMPISLPKTLQEQQKIADCLSSLDNLITAQKQKLEALKTHKKGLMQQLFPAEGETVPKLRFAEFRESGDWEHNVLTGKGVASFINEKTTNNYLKLETYISTENILPDYAGIMLASKLPAYGSFTKFQKSDILISNIRPYLKKVWFADTDGAASNDIIVIRADYKINPLFLSFILKNDEFISFIMKSAEGVKMPRGDKDVIKEYPLTFPKPEEQQKIADCLSSLDELTSAQKEKIETLKTHKKGLMQQLFPNINA